MHDDQIAISREQVTALITDQLPDLDELGVKFIGGGTVNTIFRIGEFVSARFPLRNDDADRLRERLQNDMSASAEFVRACPVPAPEPLHLGEPGHGYPLPWTTQSWLPGTTATPTSCEGSSSLALEVASLLRHLRGWDTKDRRFRGGGRGGALTDHDDWIDHCIQRSQDLVDAGAMRAGWSQLRRLPREDPDDMSHRDLIPSNLLVVNDRLAGVLDTGGFQAADPSLDLVVAWHLFDDGPREKLREDLDCSDLQGERGKAWAFQQAAGAYWYYQHTNRMMADMGRTTLDRVLSAL